MCRSWDSGHFPATQPVWLAASRDIDPPDGTMAMSNTILPWRYRFVDLTGIHGDPAGQGARDCKGEQ
jgi:hypothetical protein